MQLLKEDLYSGVNTSQLPYSSTLLLLLQLLLEKQFVIIMLRHGPGFFGCFVGFFFLCHFLQLYRETKHAVDDKGDHLYVWNIYF